MKKDLEKMIKDLENDSEKWFNKADELNDNEYASGRAQGRALQSKNVAKVLSQLLKDHS